MQEEIIMLERFNEQEIELITNCAETVHSIENYRVNQRDINSMFGLQYLYTDPDDDYDKNIKGVKEIQEEYDKVSNYHKMTAMISEKFPDMNKAYLPFIVGDLMKEAYEKK